MDETIGVKGGHNDLRRSKIIQENRVAKEKEEEEIQELEKDVRKKQRFVIIRAVPIAILGGTIKTIYDISHGEKPDKQEENSQFIVDDNREPKKKRVVLLPNGKQVVVQVSSPKIIEEEKVVELPVEEKPITIPSIPSSDSKPIDDVREETVLENQTEDKLEEKHSHTIQKLKNRKIIDEYERQLEEIRFQLRNLVFDYQVLEEEQRQITFKKDAEEILERLSIVIDRLEELKEKIKIQRLEDIDDNYIYVLIEDYLSEFQEGKLVKELKDSPLYIMISDKIQEIDKKKDSFEKDLSTKKEELEEKEESFEQLKEKFTDFKKIDTELEQFQLDQEKVIAELQRKIRDAVSVEEKVRIRVEEMNLQTKRILRIMALSMFLRGNRSARSLASTTAAYLLASKALIKPPRTIEEKYQIIHVKDYSKEIESSLSSIEEASRMLSKTSDKVDEFIVRVKNEFGDYIGVLPECDELLSNLYKMKSNLREKEYEMEKIKEEQRLLLERNNAKVLKRGEYLM